MLVARRAGGSDHCGVGTQTIGGVLDVLDEVLSLLEVDPDFSTQVEAELLLIGSGINGDDSQPPSDAVLNSKVSKTSSSTWEDDPITLLGLGVLDSTVDSDTST